MNRTAFLADFYGPTLLWYGPIFGTMGLLAVMGNALLIWIGLSTPSIRSVTSNWFVLSMGISDFFYGLNGSVFSVIAYFCGRNGSCPVLVKFSSALSVLTIQSAIVFPTFIVFNRYLKITTLPSDSNRLRIFFTSNKSVCLLIFVACSYVLINVLVLASFDQLGEDLFGLYCAKRYTNFWVYLVYLTSGSYGVSSYYATYYFYGKLQKFIIKVEHRGSIHSTRQRRRHENAETRAVMRMVKLSTLIPMITQGGVLLLDGGQWFLPIDLLPMWSRRLFMILFAVSPMCGPWVSMLILGPFKREFERRIGVNIRAIKSLTNTNAVIPVHSVQQTI